MGVTSTRVLGKLRQHNKQLTVISQYTSVFFPQAANHLWQQKQRLEYRT
jgi:hypothetical protein